MAVNRLIYRVNKGQISIPVKADFVDAKVLVSTATEVVTVATTAQVVILRGNLDFYVNFNATTAVIPAADITDGTSPVFLGAGTPHAYELGTIVAFGIIAPAATIVTMEFYI